VSDAYRGMIVGMFAVALTNIRFGTIAEIKGT